MDFWVSHPNWQHPHTEPGLSGADNVRHLSHFPVQGALHKRNISSLQSTGQLQTSELDHNAPRNASKSPNEAAKQSENKQQFCHEIQEKGKKKKESVVYFLSRRGAKVLISRSFTGQVATKNAGVGLVSVPT